MKYTKIKMTGLVMFCFIGLFFCVRLLDVPVIISSVLCPLPYMVYEDRVAVQGAGTEIIKTFSPLLYYVKKESDHDEDYEPVVSVEVADEQALRREMQQEILQENMTGKRESVSENAALGQMTERTTNETENQPGNQRTDQKADSVEKQVPVSDNRIVEAMGKRQELNPADYPDRESVLKNFYVLDSTTYIEENELNIDEMLNKDLTIDKGDEKNPKILIYHTHSQEGYMDSDPSDDMTGVLGVGEELTRILSQEYGYSVLHHMGRYDVESRDYAYGNALPDIKQVLKEHPSIEVLIDLHRDGVSDQTRLVTQLNGQDTATLMLFNGLSRTKKMGKIAYLDNPNLETNLAFSLQLQWKMQEYYTGLARKIYLKGYRYNMHLLPRTLLIELGAQTNTREEVMRSLPYLARCLDMVLGGEEVLEETN